jgi:hypothetical protein
MSAATIAIKVRDLIREHGEELCPRVSGGPLGCVHAMPAMH